MAEIAQDSGGGKGGKVRSKKASTKIDMTPMVDLGFLLITFFILTTTLQKPVVMELGMPDKTETEKQETTPLKESDAITILLDKDDKIYWYQGTGKDVASTTVEPTDYSAKGIRTVLLQKKASIGEKFTAVIKATDDASYKNLIDILDEMAITESRRYAIVDIHPNDLAIIKKGEGGETTAAN
jgi:biopolymer transport protein ExbD